MVKVESVHFTQNGIVNIELSDKRKFRLPDQFWINLNFPCDEALPEHKIEVLENESNYTKLREKILHLLASREHSVFELQRKIKQGFLKSRIKNFNLLFKRCIKEMQEKDFQSDERFTRHFVNSRIANKLEGPYKILQNLQIRGVDLELAKSILKEEGDHELWVKKTIDCLKSFHKKNKNFLETSLYQKLYQRGFPWEIIQQALDEYKKLK